MEKLLLILVIAGVAVAFPFWEPPYPRTSLGNNIDVSTMKVLKAAYDESSDKNVVSSPLGLMMLLSLYNQYSGPEAGAELNQFLGGADAQKNFDSYKELNALFSSINPDHLTIAEKISVSKDYTLSQAFAASAREYKAEFDSLDFSKPAEAAAEINKWSAAKTNGHIPEPVSEDKLNPDVVAALYNVIYFNGHWHVPFKANETQEKDFHVSKDKVVKKPMMHLLQSIHFFDSAELEAKMIELPYKEQDFRMVVVLPNEVDGLPKVLNKIVEKGLLSSVSLLEPVNNKVDVDLPKFDIRSKLDFNIILPKVGVSKIFDHGAAGIVEERPVKVDKAFQEAFIKVNEEGATAGAFTGVTMVPYSEVYPPPQPIKFIADHPFLYAILHKDKILFAGTYSA